MAQKVTITLVDDIDEKSEATQTVAFGLDGTSYEIDLTDKNANALRNALAKYIGSARKVKTGTRRTRSTGARSGSASNSAHSAREIRDWARSNGYDVPSRGRIPADVRTAFEASH